MLTRIDHVGIACRDLDAKIAFYESTFGLTVASMEVNEAQGVREAMLQVAAGPAGASYVQLLEPLGPDTPVGKFLERRGEGVHHVGYGVANITAALASLGSVGRPAHRRTAAARVDGRLHRVPAPGRHRRGPDGACAGDGRPGVTPTP